MTDEAIVRRVAPEVRVAAETFELRSVTDDGTYLEGCAAPYGRWVDVGSYDERFAPRVFAESLNRRANAIPLCVNHKVSEIAVGRPVEWLDGDDELRGVWRFDTRPEAKEIARLASEGILTGLSVHFQAGRKKADNTIERVDDGSPKGRPRVTRHNARLLEVSLVSVPAYPGAGVSLVRTVGIDDLEHRVAVDTRAERLRAEHEQWKARIASLEIR